MLKMTFPTDESMRFEMKRVMHGYVDVLYLDEDMRITKGNHGSIVVTTREGNTFLNKEMVILQK